MLEMWEQVKLLGHMGKVYLKGVVNDELLDIDRDAELLSLCDKVSLSYKRVVLIFVQHIEEEGVAVNEDCEEVAMALNEHSENIGPVGDENGASTEGSGPLNNDKEGRPLNNEGSRADIGDTDVEDSEDSEEEDKEENLDFVDSTYEQSENECELLTKDDKAFENYVDQLEVVEDPNAHVDEDRESTDVAKSDVESLDSSSYDEDDGNQKKRKKKLPKFQEFRPETDMRNPMFKLGLRRMITFKCNDRDRKATSISEGTYEKQYELLWDYAAELRRTNVGSTVIIKCELEGERPRFQRIYICLAAVKQGILHGCRPVIGFDACHIKGHHPGQLLSVVGVDPNNGMYSIVYAVAKVENYETWSWFCQLLADDIGIENNSGYVFITDKQKGLIDARVGVEIANGENWKEHNHPMVGC
ncbi:unnamed protein product [Prunus armeniaca]